MKNFFFAAMTLCLAIGFVACNKDGDDNDPLDMTGSYKGDIKFQIADQPMKTSAYKKFTITEEGGKTMLNVSFDVNSGGDVNIPVSVELGNKRLVTDAKIMNGSEHIGNFTGYLFTIPSTTIQVTANDKILTIVLKGVLYDEFVLKDGSMFHGYQGKRYDIETDATYIGEFSAALSGSISGLNEVPAYIDMYVTGQKQ